MNTIQPLRTQNVAEAVPLLTNAFLADNGMRTLADHTHPAYHQRLAYWFHATLTLHLALQQPNWIIIQNNELAGIAIVNVPTQRLNVRAWLRWILAVGRHCGVGMIWRTIRHEHQRARYRPVQPHAVLEFIAVQPAYRKQGLATALLDTVADWIKQQACSTVWLETTRQQNVRFFEQSGYRIIGQKRFKLGNAFFMCLDSG